MLHYIVFPETALISSRQEPIRNTIISVISYVSMSCNAAF